MLLQAEEKGFSQCLASWMNAPGTGDMVLKKVFRDERSRLFHKREGDAVLPSSS